MRSYMDLLGKCHRKAAQLACVVPEMLMSPSFRTFQISSRTRAGEAEFANAAAWQSLMPELPYPAQIETGGGYRQKIMQQPCFPPNLQKPSREHRYKRHVKFVMPTMRGHRQATIANASDNEISARCIRRSVRCNQSSETATPWPSNQRETWKALIYIKGTFSG